MFSNNIEKNSLQDQILSYDPLVSDTACQNRAVYLVALARELNGLSDEDRAALEAARLLTQTKKIIRHDLGYIVKETTDITNIPPEYKNAVSNTAKNKLIAENKALIAARSLAFLQASCNFTYEGEYQFYCDIDKKDKRAKIILSSKKIPILPIYFTAKMMMQYVVNNNVPLVVKYKRIIVSSDQEICDGSAQISYRANNDLRMTVSPLNPTENIPIIVIDMFCKIDFSKLEDNAFLAEKNFQNCLASFKTIDITYLVMLIAASHAPYTPTTVVDNDDPMRQIPDPNPSLMISSVNLNKFSPDEFSRLRGVASKMGIFQKRLFVDHVYASTSQRLQEN